MPEHPLAIEAFHWPGGRAVKVVVSPGIRWDHPTLVELRQSGVEVIGEMAVAWGLPSPRCPGSASPAPTARPPSPIW
ncbi:hypothetical protein [Cyanobium sp. ATX-6F1]|uniref:hypothetical protein n=1 Tax=Cyanobium sp. ATX-6F1 TaxID=3137388 RepID=UPI0039BE4F45